MRSLIALMSAPAAKTSSLPAITMQRTSGSGSSRSSAAGDLVHHLGGERVAGLGPVQPQQGDVPVDRDLDRGSADGLVRSPLASVNGVGFARLVWNQTSHSPGSASMGVIALIPVAARPMISFWICEVPS